MNCFDVIILGAGASGLMCAATARRRGLSVLVLDHQPKPGTKILISGGGRCNFSNLKISADHYRSHNPKFCLSALRRFAPEHMLHFLEKHGVAYEIKNETQLFCKRSSRELLNALVKECEGVEFKFGCKVNRVDWVDEMDGEFRVDTSQGVFVAKSLVVATGGITCPHLGATDLGFKIAKNFGHTVIAPQPALVSLTFNKKDLTRFGPLSGISVLVRVTWGKKSHTDSLLFTHTGLSGPAIHNISLYAQPGEIIEVNLCPNKDIKKYLQTKKTERPKAFVKTILSEILPDRFVSAVKDDWFVDRLVGQVGDTELGRIASAFENWQVTPEKKNEIDQAYVTAGGVDTRELSSKTFESQKIKGLYFIGEVVDVAGEEGGYNLHWAWASGWCAGQAIIF